ncbi:MAG: hypothetical protein JRC86_05380 [Deltaproteobacteria bacterium]|nr:hypothetical protein [Deltaproteobacteria bacterium]
MAWHVYPLYLIAGTFLANGVPHFVNGISGNNFQSPFATPPAVGESSPVINVIWGVANFVIGFLLLAGVGDFSFGLTVDTMIVGIGMLGAGVGLAMHFGRVRGSYDTGKK